MTMCNLIKPIEANQGDFNSVLKHATARIAAHMRISDKAMARLAKPRTSSEEARIRQREFYRRMNSVR